MEEKKSSSEETSHTFTVDNTVPVNTPNLLEKSSISDVIERVQSISQQMVFASENLVPALERFSEIAKAIGSAIVKLNSIDFSGIISSFSSWQASIAETLANIQIPTVSEERKQELIESHRRWGSYGWTFNPVANFDTLFDIAPESKAEADKAAIKLCSPKQMERIFVVIKERPRTKKDDFEEAVFDFHQKKYKSCALVLLTLIDAQLIRLQKKSQKRAVGKGAVRAAKERALTDVGPDMLFTALFYSNIFSCLEVLFEKGNNFVVQPNVMNRNFLDHGMLRRKVTRKDCVQLFLLYYNMLELLDMIYFKR